MLFGSVCKAGGRLAFRIPKVFSAQLYLYKKSRFPIGSGSFLGEGETDRKELRSVLTIADADITSIMPARANRFDSR